MPVTPVYGLCYIEAHALLITHAHQIYIPLIRI